MEIRAEREKSRNADGCRESTLYSTWNLSTLHCSFVKSFKSFQGITLIGLVLTIIVLLILVTVGIRTIAGQNGIITMAAKASNKAVVEQEKISLLMTNFSMENISNGITFEEFFERERNRGSKR